MAGGLYQPGVTHLLLQTQQITLHQAALGAHLLGKSTHHLLLLFEHSMIDALNILPAPGTLGRIIAGFSAQYHALGIGHRLELQARVDGAALARALDGSEVELIAEDVRLAARALGRITGRVDVEDVLDAIFGEFCIGK